MSVYKRGNKGVFYMNFIINGVRVTKSTGKFTKKEAKQVEALERQKLLEKAALTPHEKAAKMLFTEAIEEVYKFRWKNNKDGKPVYNKAYRIAEIIGDIPICEIDDDVVKSLFIKLQEKKLATGTINRYMATLKTILRFKKQASDCVIMRKEPKGRIRVLSKDEENMVCKLLREAKLNVRNQFYIESADLFEVLVNTGMRLSEAINIRYDDINFDTGMVTIWINKGDRPRSVPMAARVREILLKRHSDNKIKPFTIDKNQAGHAWNYARKRMKLSKDKQFVIHALRHTTATRLVNRGVSLYVVKEWLGHADITTTQKYAHLSPESLSQALLELEKYNI